MKSVLKKEHVPLFLGKPWKVDNRVHGLKNKFGSIKCRMVNAGTTQLSTEDFNSASSRSLSSQLPVWSNVIDTHCHLDMILSRLDQQDPDSWRVNLPLEEKFAACITIGCSLKALDPTQHLLQYDNIYGAFGLHPLSAHEWDDDVAERVQSLLTHPKAVAVGEAGLDYHYESDPEVHEVQKKVFRTQMELSTALDLPLVIHTREAESDTLALMREHLPKCARVHVHCFTSSLEMASQLLADFPNLCIGFTGVITFKNAQEIRDVVKIVPLDRILLETDGPFMAPVPYRGKVAHPGHIPKIAAEVAKVKDIDYNEVLEITRQNANRMYGI